MLLKSHTADFSRRFAKKKNRPVEMSGNVCIVFVNYRENAEHHNRATDDLRNLENFRDAIYFALERSPGKK